MDLTSPSKLDLQASIIPVLTKILAVPKFHRDTMVGSIGNTVTFFYKIDASSVLCVYSFVIFNDATIFYVIFLLMPRGSHQ